MENEILKEMSSYELYQTLQATSRSLDFADTFTDVYSEILRRAKESNDLRHLKKAQDLRWRQTEYLVQEWLKNYESPTLTHDARFAG